MRKLKNHLIYAGIRFWMSIVGHCPAGLVKITGTTLGTLAYLLASFERKIAISQLKKAFHLETKPRRAKILARGVFHHLGISVVELCRMIRNPNNAPPMIISDDSRSSLDTALASQKGVVFITGHIGNWELLAISLVKEGYKVSTVAKESYDSRLTKLIERNRKTMGVTPIYRNAPGAPTAMMRALKNNSIMGFLIDQDTDVESVFVPFLGQVAKTPVGAARFAIRTQTPVVVGTIKRHVNGTHQLKIEPVSLPKDVEKATAILTKMLEKRIVAQVSQWVWFHRRWRSQKTVNE